MATRQQGEAPGTNCWEVIRCGRGPDGANARTLGVCPAVTETRLDGINHGVNGGRVCWVVPPTPEMGVITSILSGGRKLTHCVTCSFFQRVEREEGRSFSLLHEAMDRFSLPPRTEPWH